MNEVQKQFETRLGRFGRVRRGVANGALAYGIGVLALCVGIGALILLRGWRWSASPFVNAGVDAVPALAAAVLLLWLLVRLFRRWEGRRSALSEAFRAEALAGDLNSRLISAVDFMGWPHPTPLTESVVQHARRDLERPFEKLLDRTVRNRLRLRFALLLVVFVLLGSTPWFSFARTGHTLALCASNIRELLLPTRFEIFPGTKIFRIGAKAEAGLRFTRFRYPQVTMLTEVADREGVERTVLNVDASGRAAVALQPTVERQYRIRFEFGNRVTESMLVTFTTAPMIENMQIELVYPLYTRLVPKEIEGVVDRVTALAGTRVNMGYVFNKPLKSAVLTFDDQTRMPLDVVGRFASVSFVHTRERAAKLQVEDIHGFTLDAPQGIDFGLTVDNPPKLVVPPFLKQDMPMTLDALAGFTFGVKVLDDYGASKCVVKWRQSTVEEPNRIKLQGEPIERAFLPPRPTALAAFENLFRDAAQSATPGDLFSFQIEAFDNHEPKAQSAVSSLFSIFVRGVGMEGVGSAESGADIFAKFGSHQGGPGPSKYKAAEGSKGIKMPTAIVTGESFTRGYTADRPDVGVRSEVRGAMGSAASDYGSAILGAGK